MWTFVELHGQHYGKMAEVWNEEHPDQTIEITCTTYPYSDMHTKLLTALQAGTGAPDICDVEVGQFPNVVAGLDQWLVPWMTTQLRTWRPWLKHVWIPT